MPADANIFQQYLQPPRSAVDYANDYATADARRNQNALQALTLQQQTAVTGQALEERNALRQIAASSGGSREALIQGMRNSGMPGLMTQADALEQSGAKLAESQSTAAKNNADAGKTTFGTQQDKYKSAVQRMVSLGGPQDAIDDISREVSAGNIPMEAATPLLRSIPTDPAAFNVWKLKMVAGLSDPNQMVDLLKPHIQTSNTGGQTVTQAVDPLTGAPTTTGTLQNTVAPDAQLQANTARRGQDIAAATAKAGQQIEAVKADPYGTLGLRAVPAGVAAASTLSGDDYLKTLPPALANQVKMLAEGRMPITANSARSPQMMQLLAMASQYEPGTDATTYVQRAQTVKDFAPGGKDGQQITNLNTAIHHAGQLSDAITSLDNSNVLPGITNPVENLIGQKVLGQTSQGVYKQKADALSSELRKVYAGGGGGSLSELTEWQKSFDPNASQDQQRAYLNSGMELLVGALQAKRDAYERGMGSRAHFGQFITPESSQVLRRLAPDFAAQISTASGAGGQQPTTPGLPPDIEALVQKHGGK